jgi:hypothetical protein
MFNRESFERIERTQNMSDQEPTPEQRAELERMGPERVSLMLANWAGGHAGPQSMIGGFASGDIRRSAIDHWLEKALAERRAQKTVERVWVKIAAWAAIVSAVAAVVGVVIQIMTAR